MPPSAMNDPVLAIRTVNITALRKRICRIAGMRLSAAESKATYQEIQEWVQEKYGFHVSHLNIAKTKRKCGIIERQNYNLPKSEDSRSPETPKEKEEAIIEAFKAFQMI